MAHIELDVSYTLRLTSAEFRLLTLSLAGKLRSREEVREALLLNERLCDQRARYVAQLNDVAHGAHNKAAELCANNSESEPEGVARQSSSALSSTSEPATAA